MLRWVTPTRYVASATQLDPRALWGEGVRGVVLDLDNTVVAWDAPAPTSEVQVWIGQLRSAGIQVCIVSNNFTRAREIAQMLQVPVVAGAIKPAPWAFRRAMAIMGTSARQTVLVGDQLFTDVLGGNLLGMRTVLVDPLSRDEFPTTKIVRAIERLIRARVVTRVKPHR